MDISKFKWAWAASYFATDLRRPIGAAIFDGDTLVAYGSNQASIKWRWFINWHKTHCLRKIFKTPKNKWYWFCPGCANGSNHAERVAIRNIPFTNEPKKYIMYLYGHSYCCTECLKHIKKANIEEVKFYE